ncbi:MAG: cytochrome-c peroxidase, partial [Methylocystis sp.]
MHKRPILQLVVSTMTVAGLLLAGSVQGPVLAESAHPAVDAKKLIEEAKTTGLAPLPVVPAPADARITLGRRLFYENRASQDDNVSCGHCHQAELAASDGLPKSIGVFGKVNPRNAPSIFNAGLQFKQHWRGDRESLEDQAEKSLTGAASFGNPDFAAVKAKLLEIPGYKEAFAKAFPGDPDPVSSKNFGLAVAAFERTLLSPSRYDAFLAGDAKALSAAEQAGLHKFIEVGCASC